MNLLPLVLIPACSILNHLGGQSTSVPDPRFVCRMLGQAAAFAFVVCAMRNDPLFDAELFIIGFAGISFWAAWKNGPEFMSFTAVDSRDYTTPWYTPNRYITALCDTIMGVSQLTKLTPAQCRNWGTLYGTILGAFLYPLFAGLGWALTPYAYEIGAVCLLQGLVYRWSGLVLKAEYVWGATGIGAALAAVLMLWSVQ